MKFFPALFQTDLNNRSQETNDKKGIQFHGVVTNNRIFNLIHSVQEKKFSLFSLIKFKVFKSSGQRVDLHVRGECRPRVQHVLAPKTICMK